MSKYSRVPASVYVPVCVGMKNKEIRYIVVLEEAVRWEIELYTTLLENVLELTIEVVIHEIKLEEPQASFWKVNTKMDDFDREDPWMNL